jgi:glycerophosphoryl diester phosphodiesterase
MLELGVGVTRDGKVVVIHDTTVDGKTNGHGTLASKTLRQIRWLDAAFWFATRRTPRCSLGCSGERSAFSSTCAWTAS